MKKYGIILSFKGTRDYIQGPDVVNAMLDITGPVEQLSIQIHKKMSGPLIAYIADEAEISMLRKSGKLCAFMSYRDINNNSRIMVVIEDTNKCVMQRIPYDEELVIVGAEVIGRKITQKIPADGHFIERVVALNKMLLNNIFGKESWIFVRLDLLSIPQPSRCLILELSQEIGSRTFKSSISSDKETLGSIIFTRVDTK